MGTGGLAPCEALRGPGWVSGSPLAQDVPGGRCGPVETQRGLSGDQPRATAGYAVQRSIDTRRRSWCDLPDRGDQLPQESDDRLHVCLASHVLAASLTEGVGPAGP